jgi:type II secretory pathway component PulL
MSSAPLLRLGLDVAGTDVVRPKHQLLSASVSPEVLASVHLCSAWLGVTASRLVRLAVADYLERHAERLAPIADRLEIAVTGCLAPDRRYTVATRHRKQQGVG